VAPAARRTGRAHGHTLDERGVTTDTGPSVVAVVGATASGKSALAIALAERVGGEVVSCDSTAVYRGFDIGTDKVPIAARRGVPHHLIDVADPGEQYSAARYARDAADAIHAITASGRVPILAGGSGLYYRALTRGLFPGPGRDDQIRERLGRIARRWGPEWLHRMVARVDEASARRIHPRDEKRLVRALEVYFLSGRPLTEHFAETRSPVEGHAFVTFALRLPAAGTAERVRRRVNQQFDDGLLNEVRGLRAAGVPDDAHPFTGLVYRQALEHLDGVRNEAETRALIVRENQRYARRQLIWFRKEPNLHWLDTPGEVSGTLTRVLDMLAMPSLTGEPTGAAAGGRTS
jgi:tRNA dimethylallyltransferase